MPPLENGDRLDQKTFHERYEAMPENFHAELIGGIVYVSSPMKPRHGRTGARTVAWLAAYQAETPGTDVLENTTNIMGPESEPQPDGCLIVLPEYGGQTRENEDGYLEGAPEFIAEIGLSTESIDLHRKKEDYEQAGVREYMVAALRMRKIFWFVRRRGKFKELPPGPDGIFRSEIFPGLWLDPDALLRGDTKKLLAVLRQGLASTEHSALVARLASKKS